MRTTFRITAPALLVAGALAAPMSTAAPVALARPAVAPAAGTAAAPTLATATAADARIASMLTARATPSRFGSSFAGTVVDAASGATIWTKRGNSPYLPASNAKLFTALTALTALGPDARFTTAVKQGSAINRVVILGNGDPLMSSAQVDALARTTAAALKARGVTAPRVYVDDNYFPAPTLAPGWKSSYVLDDVTPVRPLVRDNLDVMDTSRDVGLAFRARLRAYGLTSAGYFGRTDVSGSARTIASTRSVTVTEMVNRMLLTSDNDVAEILLRKASSTLGHGRTWSGARAAQIDAASSWSLAPTALYDGSGLSRSDRLTTNQLVTLLRRGLDTRNTALAPLRSSRSMPLAGRTGTLKTRFRTAPASCAAGKVYAKTGSLGDVVALSGWTTGKDGRVKVFSFVVNGRESTTTLKRNVDLLAATVNGCV